MSGFDYSKRYRKGTKALRRAEAPGKPADHCPPTAEQIAFLTKLAAELGHPSWQAYIRERSHQYGLAESYSKTAVSRAIDAALLTLERQGLRKPHIPLSTQEHRTLSNREATAYARTARRPR